MRKTLPALLFTLMGFAVAPASSRAQEPGAFFTPGEEAPEIQVAGATRYGILREPVSLRELRGETVVLAFFFRARTGG